MKQRVYLNGIKQRKNWQECRQDGSQEDTDKRPVLRLNVRNGRIVACADPSKVVRVALQDAASIAGLLVTTEVMVADVPADHSPAPAMPDMGGMGGMM